MKELLEQVEVWLAAGLRVVAATVVRVDKSAPRQPGAMMVVNERGEVMGSVSGGCVEAALYEEAMEVLQSGVPKRLRYGIADEQAFSIGLTCGGTIYVFIERLDWPSAILPTFARQVRGEHPVALATVTSGPHAGGKLLVWEGEALGSTGSPVLDEVLTEEVRAMLRQGQTGLRHFGAEGQRRQDEVEVFVESFAPPPRMFVFGAIDFAAAAVRMGKFLGYRVTLCDARPVFATRARFPDADELVVAWPHEYLADTVVGPRDVVLILTHDPKFDVPVLLTALRTPALFIGALGSRSTHERRQQALLAAGVSPADLARIASPVGLDLGSRTPEETAVSIAAELIALRNGRSGGRLRDQNGPIHAADAVTVR